MILSTILALTFIVFIIVFGDVIVCMIFIGWIIKRLFKRRKK